MRNKVWWVYALSEPITHAVRYVGITTEPLERLRQHMWGTNVHNPELDAWLKAFRRISISPELMILERVANAGWKLRGSRERFWVEKYHDDGCRLFNKQLNPSFDPPKVEPLNGNTHAGQIRRALDKLGWDADLEDVQREVGPRVHFLEGHNRKWDGSHWVTAARKTAALLPLSYIYAIRRQGPRFATVALGT